MHLFAISDLHLDRQQNWDALRQLPAQPDDWLIVAGDVSDNLSRFEQGMALLAERFARVLWTPGNHDLWTLPNDTQSARGVVRYQQLVAICRRHGVLTPEDAYVRWPGSSVGDPIWLAPTFTLYDYSFRPDDVALADAVDWAAKTDVIATDEILLHPDPYPSRAAWCADRVRATAEKLSALDHGRIILINHFPLHPDLVILPRIPRFSLWCGTQLTADWHRRFPLHTIVYGHLHIRSSRHLDGVRCEEVSLGYPQNWQPSRGIRPYLRQIL